MTPALGLVGDRGLDEFEARCADEFERLRGSYSLKNIGERHPGRVPCRRLDRAFLLARGAVAALPPARPGTRPRAPRPLAGLGQPL